MLDTRHGSSMVKHEEQKLITLLIKVKEQQQRHNLHLQQ